MTLYKELTRLWLQAVRDGRLEVHGAILNCATGMVQFIGEHPVQAEICRLGLNE